MELLSHHHYLVYQDLGWAIDRTFPFHPPPFPNLDGQKKAPTHEQTHHGSSTTSVSSPLASLFSWASSTYILGSSYAAFCSFPSWPLLSISLGVVLRKSSDPFHQLTHSALGGHHHQHLSCNFLEILPHEFCQSAHRQGCGDAVEVPSHHDHLVYQDLGWVIDITFPSHPPFPILDGQRKGPTREQTHHGSSTI